MHRITKVLYSGAIACSIVAGGVVSASATNTGNQGCTPGYWKNHTSNWLETGDHRVSGDTDVKTTFQPNDPVSELFPAASKYGLQSITFLQALQSGGGSTNAGAARTLLRAATAASLNAAHEGLGYPLSRFGPDGILARVNAALRSGDRAAMLNLAAELDRLNNLGCPLN